MDLSIWQQLTKSSSHKRVPVASGVAQSIVVRPLSILHVELVSSLPFGSTTELPLPVAAISVFIVGAGFWSVYLETPLFLVIVIQDRIYAYIELPYTEVHFKDRIAHGSLYLATADQEFVSQACTSSIWGRAVISHSVDCCASSQHPTCGVAE